MGGLADAEFGAGNYPAARDSYPATLALAPNDAGARQRLAECNRILALDPTLPRLAAVARYTRGRQPFWRYSTSAARARWIRRRFASGSPGQRPASYGDAAEANLAEAEQLWQARPQSCASAEDAVSLVMKKLARR